MEYIYRIHTYIYIILYNSNEFDVLNYDITSNNHLVNEGFIHLKL